MGRPAGPHARVALVLAGGRDVPPQHRERAGDRARHRGADRRVGPFGPRGLDEVFELSPVGTFVLDADGRVAWANRAVADYFGLERDALVGREQADVVRGSLAPAIEDGEGMAARLLGEEGIEKFECHVLAGEGREERWLQYWSQPVTDGEYAGGRIEHYYDITDRRTLEAELERDLDALGELYEVSASGLPFREKVERLLEYGRNHLGVQVGALNHIHDGRQDTLVAAGDTGAAPVDTALGCLLPAHHREHRPRGDRERPRGGVRRRPGLRDDGLGLLHRREGHRGRVAVRDGLFRR
ncbi:PAS domain-containing protein [Halosegnis marinus]|uniref:PAS domain-containing protein n=1 Tax=Halosegnis marinus TaxID=3034023 RepID=UPI00360E3222